MTKNRNISDDNLRAKTPRHGSAPLGIQAIVQLIVVGSLALLGFSAVWFLVGAPLDPLVVVLPFGGPDESAVASEPEVVGLGLYEAVSQRPIDEPWLSPIFTPSIQYWKDDIIEWASEHDLDPNLVATVMQIESCGYPRATSVAGAMGLFQVMPFHFETGEDGYDPETNALRGMIYLSRGLNLSNGHAGLALAGYNGGHGVINRDYNTWANETQRYFRWGSGIYREASAGWQTSPTLDDWYTRASGLCGTAESYLGISAN
ncbi:MAG: lytic transglycosylase domain-containing protein [Chloroflexi bacterium]|nr:lytic transglycosylase domain-containing protein [Chloroflexota bacterium]